jgi:hydroxymethylglutaryl-CoA lyase
VALQLGNALGRGLANFQAAVKAGIQHFDTTLAGIGCGRGHRSGIAHCLPTEDVVAFCQDEGIATGVDLPRLVRTARYAGEKLGLATLSLYAPFCDPDGLPLHPSRWRCQL